MSIFQKDFCSISFDSKIFEILFANRRQHLFMSVCNLYNYGAFSFVNPHCTFYMCFFIIYHVFYMKKPIQSSGANRVFRRRISSSISSFITYSCAALFSCKTKSGSVPLSLPPSLIAARGRQSLKKLKYSHMRPICCTFLYKKTAYRRLNPCLSIPALITPESFQCPNPPFFSQLPPRRRCRSQPS